MSFNEQLEEYIKIIGCSATELSNITGVSASIISRFRKGVYTPKYESEIFNKLVTGIYILVRKYKIEGITKESINESLGRHLKKDDIDFETFKNNFNLIINNLKINVSDLSKYIGFDSSFISKIRSGIRKPQNINEFANATCKYVINNYYKSNDCYIQDLIKCNNEDLKDPSLLHQKLFIWLTNNKYIEQKKNEIDSFIKKLDSFDLNYYIKAIKFDKLFTPTFPKFKSKSKVYYGIDGYKDAQLEVLKLSAFLKSKDNIFWYSNMPMIEVSKDLKFTKKYMMYLAFILKKGIKLNIIHDLNRPFKELLLGLEGWIPLYMTGQISPYYFKDSYNGLYSNVDCVSGNAILHGESISKNIKSSKFLVSTKNDDLKYYKEISNLLLKKATPLMEIYTPDKKNEFLAISNNKSLINIPIRNILLNLPNYTISDELLDEILTQNNISIDDKNLIFNFINAEKKRINEILINSKMVDEIALLSEEDFKNSGCILDLSKIYYNKRIKYTYEQYKKHINLLKQFKKKNKNYNYKINNKNIFKNIDIHILKDKQVIISKVNDPITHFVIHHQQLINAFQNFDAPINEKK